MTAPVRPVPPSRLQRLLASSLGIPLAQAADASAVAPRAQQMLASSLSSVPTMQADAGFGEVP